MCGNFYDASLLIFNIQNRQEEEVNNLRTIITVTVSRQPSSYFFPRERCSCQLPLTNADFSLDRTITTRKATVAEDSPATPTTTELTAGLMIVGYRIR